MIRRIISTVVIITAALFAASIAAQPAESSADDAYLLSVDQAAKGLELDRAGTAVSLPDNGGLAIPEPNRSDRELEPNAIFDEVLKQHYLGSYGFYSRLTAEQQARVREEYRQSRDMDQVREVILKLFRSY